MTIYDDEDSELELGVLQAQLTSLSPFACTHV
jgi:hypothetical protein